MGVAMVTVLVVIPTYNEVSNITRIISSVRSVLVDAGYDYRFLIVDDNSPDGTAEAVGEMRGEDERVNILKRPGKMGLGSAYVEGFTWALSHLPFDILVQMDADFSHPPPAVLKMVKPVVEGFAVAIASRYVEGGGSAGWGLRRRVISRVANFLTRILLGLDVSDATSGFKALSRRAVQDLLKYRLNSRGYSYQVECLLIFKDIGLNMKAVPFVFEPRLSGEAKLSFGEILRFAGFLVKASFSGVKRKEA